MKYNIYVAGNITLQVLVLMIEYLVAMSFELWMTQHVQYLWV